MRTLLCLAALAGPAAAQGIDISGHPLGATPADDYVAAVRVFDGGDPLEGACLFYRGQFRYRVHLAARPEADDAPLFASLSETVGRPINEWVGGDLRDWVAVLDCGLAWVDASDDPLTPRAAFPEAWVEQRAGFQELRDVVAAQDPAQLRARREAAGLPNR